MLVRPWVNHGERIVDHISNLRALEVIVLDFLPVLASFHTLLLQREDDLPHHRLAVLHLPVLVGRLAILDRIELNWTA